MPGARRALPDARFVVRPFQQCGAGFYTALCALLLVLLFLTACGVQDATVAPTAAATAAAVASTVRPPTPAAAAPTATERGVASPTGAVAAGAATFQNPVLNADFPDPDVLHVGNVYYAYATNGSGKNIQLATSPDLVHWNQLGDAMPGLAPWAAPGGSNVWAPEVIPVGDHYNLYYTAHDAKSDRQCVGVAVSSKPEGKFKDTSDHPLACQADQGGDIDPDPFRDGDKLYLYYKNDGNCCGLTTHLYAQLLSADGLQLQGAPVSLVENDQPWEGRVVEAPTMLKHDNTYYLFFSGNDYAGADYAVGYATCTSALGPCKQAEEPILKSRMDQQPLVVGPGHQALLQVGAQTWIIYHAWDVVGGTRGDRRLLWIDRLDWKDGKPVVEGPTTGPQAVP